MPLSWFLHVGRSVLERAAGRRPSFSGQVAILSCQHRKGNYWTAAVRRLFVAFRRRPRYRAFIAERKVYFVGEASIRRWLGDEPAPVMLPKTSPLVAACSPVPLLPRSAQICSFVGSAAGHHFTLVASAAASMTVAS